MKLSFYKGDERTRSFKVKLDNNGVDDMEYEFTSTQTLDYENYLLNSDETKELCLESTGLKNSEWFNPNEVRRIPSMIHIWRSYQFVVSDPRRNSTSSNHPLIYRIGQVRFILKGRRALQFWFSMVAGPEVE